MKKILCVEDNQEMILILKHVLKAYQVEVAQNIGEAKNFLEKEFFNLITLDLGLPDGDGMEFLKDLTTHSLCKNTPILVLTAHEDTPHKVSAFSLGVYDYIVKPFESPEFIARVEAILRRAEAKSNSLTSLKMGDITLSIPKQKVWIDGVNGNNSLVALTSLEFRLLLNLVQAEGRVLTRTELLKEVWGEEMHVTDRTVDTHIGHLRKKIIQSKVQIQTVVGEGYRLAMV